MRKVSLTAQIITDKLVKADILPLELLLGRKNLEQVVELVLLINHQLAGTAPNPRGMTPNKFDPKLGHQRTMTDEELDNE
jgi:hypothetical protein